MENPFWKRATDYLRDDEAFLSVVSPEPIAHHLRSAGEEGVLFDRLVHIQGTPGSGKTTLARLFQFSTIVSLLRHKKVDNYRPLLDTLSSAGAVEDEQPRIIACRIPLEADYRDCWELPYPESMRARILCNLVQSRAVLFWLRQLEKAGVADSSIAFVARPDAEAAMAAIGGPGIPGIRDRARCVEKELYKVVGALLPPAADELPPDAVAPYAPFDVLESIVVLEVPRLFGGDLELRPLVILDDAHSLHPDQFAHFYRWLARRDLRIARWLLTRLDVLHPKVALESYAAEEARPGIATGRDVIEVKLQSTHGDDRTAARRAFRRMARDIADRYLSQMPLFQRRQLRSFQALLESQTPKPTDARTERLEATLRQLQESYQISDSRLHSLEAMVDSYTPRSGAIPDDVRLMMVRIILHRFLNRTPQRSLFEEHEDVDSSKPLKVDSSVLDAACMQLFHEEGRPYYYGLDAIADASSENAEQFLRLAGALVEAIADRLARQKSPSLLPREQQKILLRQATEIIASWNYPEVPRVLALTEAMAKRCRKETLSPSAWLRSGPNAFGILQSEFEKLVDDAPRLADVLHYGLAYNAFSLSPRYECQGKTWCLLELGGLVILKHGLSLRRGGFIRGDTRQLESFAFGDLNG